MATYRICKSFKVLVGLEIHVQLATKSKMFTGAANGFGGEPNSQVDEQVMGLPGVLPVMNRKAVEYAIKVGLALGCRIARQTKWDRKSYYYPDLPKNYQISQYDMPLCGEGLYEMQSESGPVPIRIRRAHLEEDAGKLLHEAPGGGAIDGSIVDLNRAGTPLLEIVTEPDFSSPKIVAQFAQELQRLVQYLGVSQGQMQMGHMRFEPNINVHITDEDGAVHKTAITEVKNLNSFNVLERAIDYEVRRQVNHFEQTPDLRQALGKKSTYGWDEASQSTYWQRDKEGEQDYRYFPDPDLVPVVVDDAWLTELKGQIGELPAARRQRYASLLGGDAKAEKAAGVLAADREEGNLFDAMLGHGADPKRAAALMEALREMANEQSISLLKIGANANRLAEIAQLAGAGRIAAGKETAKTLIAGLQQKDRPAEQAATELGLIQVSDSAAIDAAIDELIAENSKSLQDYRGGKQAARGALIGMLMKKGKGFNARLVGERLDARLKP